MRYIVGLLVVIALAQIAAAGVAVWGVIEQRDLREAQQVREEQRLAAAEQAEADAVNEERMLGAQACASAKRRASYSVAVETVPLRETLPTGTCKYRRNLDGTFATAVEVRNVERNPSSRSVFAFRYTEGPGSVICPVGVDLVLDQTTLIVASCYEER